MLAYDYNPRVRLKAETPRKPTSEVYQQLNRFKTFLSRLTEEELLRAFSQLKGRGSEHLVFFLKNRQGQEELALKINYDKTVMQLCASMAKNHSVTLAAEEAHAALKTEMTRRLGFYTELRQRFGTDAVPNTRWFIADVPMSHALMEKVGQSTRREAILDPFKVSQFPERFSFPSLAAVQKIVEKSPEAVSLHLPWLEKRYSRQNFFKDATTEENEMMRLQQEKQYAKAHRLFLGYDDMVLDKREAEYTWVMAGGDHLLKIYDLAKKDAAFKRELRKTIEGLIDLVDDTGQPLDLAGQDNLILDKTDQAWKPRLLDVMTITPVRMEVLQSFVDRMLDSLSPPSVGLTQELPYSEIYEILTALNGVRSLNALAQIAGSSKRVRLKGLESVDPKIWMQLHQRLFVR